MAQYVGEATPPTREPENPLLRTPTSGQNLTKTISPLSGNSLFEKRFDTLCREVIKPALLQVVNLHIERGSFAVLDIIDGPGPVQRSDNDYFVDNRRIILRAQPLSASLWFVAWEPSVLVQARRGAAGPLRCHPLEEITTGFVEKIAGDFLDSIGVHQNG